MGILKQEDLSEYIYDDYHQWEGEREVIEGVPYAMVPAPAKNHQVLVLAIGTELLSNLDEYPKCEVLIDQDRKVDLNTVLKPDVSAVCGDDNPNYITKTRDYLRSSQPRNGKTRRRLKVQSL